MYNFYKDYDLRLKVRNVGGNYDPEKSTSYFKQGYAHDDTGGTIGFNALETFQFDQTTLTGIQFVAATTDSDYNNYIGFAKPAYGSFLYTILKSNPDATMTFAFDNYPTSGVLSLGGTDTTRCLDDWRVIEELFFDGGIDKWGANIESLSAGKSSFSNPGHVLFSIYDLPLKWPKSIYYSLLKGLGSIDDQTVPCNTQVNITFQLGDVTFQLTPSQYLDRDMEKTRGVCMLTGTTVDNSEEFILPRSIFKDYCLSVNHFTKEIGLATRRT